MLCADPANVSNFEQSGEKKMKKKLFIPTFFLHTNKNAISNNMLSIILNVQNTCIKITGNIVEIVYKETF